MSNLSSTAESRLGSLVKTAYGDDEIATARECPSPEWWYEHEAGFLESDFHQDIAALEAHSEECARCSVERRLARCFVEEQRAAQGLDNLVAFPSTPAEVAPKTVLPEPSRERRGGFAPFQRAASSRWLAAAAVVIAAIGTFSITQSRAPGILAPGTNAVLRSLVIEAVQPIGNLTEIPSEFRWIDRNQLGSYRLIVTRVDGRTVLEGTSKETSLALSAQEQALLEPAVRYYWRVEGTTPSGETVQSIPLDFRVNP